MLTNLLWPWVLAPLLTGLSAAALCTLAWFYARDAAAPTRDDAGEAQLLRERRAELAGAVVRAALGFALLSMTLTVLAADALAGSVSGAMCAWGVFESGGGAPTLAIGLLTTLAAGCWLALHRYDFALQRPHLTQLKFRALGLLVPLVWLDLLAGGIFFYRLDLGTAASCCSAGLDAVATRWMPGSDALTREPIALLAAAGMAIAIGLNLRAARAPGGAIVGAATTIGVLSFAAAIPAILWYVAPHAYETPHHGCPFCLLHADVWGVGWPLFGALIWALTDNLSMALVARTARTTRGEEPETTRRTLRALAIRGAGAWAVALSVAVAPVVRYAWVTGGSSLF